MLLCQFIAWALAAVKRFDAVVLHAWELAKEMVRSLRVVRGEADSAG